jgi:hypothetical protein
MAIHSSSEETHDEPAPAAPPQGAPGPRAWWRGLPPRQRTILRRLFAAVVVVVLAVSVVLARFLSVENVERDADLALVQAEARGDAAGMLDQLGGCRFAWLASTKERDGASRSCAAAVEANSGDRHLRRAGAVKILQLESTTAYSLFGATGKTRLAWTVIGSKPVVQCVQVRRTGNFLTGIHVQLVGLSAPIPGEGRCTKESRLEREEEEATAVEEGR